MRDLLKQLLELQSLDTSLIKVEEDLKGLPRELSSRDGELKAKKDSVQENLAEVQEAQVKVHGIETEIKALEERVTKFDAESNTVRDNAQLFAIQHQIKSLREEIGKFEDQALALFSKIEELETEGGKIKEGLVSTEEEHERFRKNVEEEIAVRKEEKKKLQVQRDALCPSINSEILAQYERVLAKRDGVAVAAIEDSICQGCSMEIIPNDFVKLVKCKEIVYCRNCNRILYMPVEERAE